LECYVNWISLTSLSVPAKDHVIALIRIDLLRSIGRTFIYMPRAVEALSIISETAGKNVFERAIEHADGARKSGPPPYPKILVPPRLSQELRCPGGNNTAGKLPT